MLASSNSAPFPQIYSSAVLENLYTLDHPDVVRWTDHFSKFFLSRRIFETFAESHPNLSVRKAMVVGASWHLFSEQVPRLLCLAAGKLSSNRMRHYAIQTAFEELGMRNSNKIHADLFLEALSAANLDLGGISQAKSGNRIEGLLTNLFQDLELFQSDAEILGFLLGLEIPAIQNIATVFDSLAHQERLQEPLLTTPFFRIHFQVEVEHIRLSVANYLRFSNSGADAPLFEQGCNKAILFWEHFWKAVGEEISENQRGAI